MKELNSLPDARDLLKMDSAAAGQAMLAMTLEQQRARVLSLSPGRRRQDLVLLSERPEALTQSLPLEDFALTIKEIGGSDALALLEMSSNAQLTNLLDLDVWVGTDLDLGQVDHWLLLLMECGPERVLRWIDRTDFELIVLLFERWCLMVDREAIENLPDSVTDRVVSPDNYHFFLIKIGADLKRMRDLIDLLWAKDQNKLLAIIGNLGTTPPAELEELALRWRSGRLADRGWPDLEQALGIYHARNIDPDQAPAQKPAGIDQPPHYPLQQVFAGRLFPAGLAAVEGLEDRENLAGQVANLINRIIVADGLPAADPKSLDRAGKTLAGRLEIGLNQAGVQDVRQAAQALRSLPLIHLAQAAHSAILERRTRATVLLETDTGDLLSLESPMIRDRLSALLRKRPLFIAEEGELAREFGDPEDLWMLDRNLDRFAAALQLAEPLGLTVEGLPDSLPAGSSPDALEGFSLEMLLLTAFARQKLGLPKLLAPLPSDRLADLFAALPKNVQGLSDELLTWAQDMIPAELPGLERLVTDLATLAADVLVHRAAELDPRFQGSFWIGE
jgi:hypothetical protein